MWARRAQICAFSLAAAMELAATSAFADKTTDAEELFRRAKALMNEKKDKDACPLFEESEKLDPQMGTLLNLAICHENIGRVASAWGEFRAVEQMAKVANREDRVKLAAGRAAKLEPRLPRLKIVAAPENKIAGLVVKVGGEEKPDSLWGGVAVDPGTVTVETSAPGKKPISQDVKIDKEGVTVTFNVPKLDDAPVEPPVTVDPEAEKKAEQERQAQYDANKSRKTKGFILGGVGLGVAAAGGVFGVLAILKNNDAHSACPAPCLAGSTKATTANSSTDNAFLSANIANVAIPVGAIIVLIGGYLILSAGPTSGAPPKTAFIAPHPNGAALGWTF